MKSLLKKIISRAVENDQIWALLEATILRVASYATLKRQRAKEHSIVDPAIQTLFPDLRVAHGPFQGMKYPHAQAIGSYLFPKLIGSYEKELHPILDKICNSNYTEIVDIGCAEGYYAVGLAMRIPSAKVFAYDIVQKAIILCEEMAELNHVRQQIVLGNFCDAETLKSIPFTGKGLIISDCEGYEKSLFSNEIIPFLVHHDLLIEIHDHRDIEISSLIRERFKNSHQLTVFQSIDDITKTHTYHYEELSSYDLASRKILLTEDRVAIQEWFYLTPRTL